MYFYRHLKTCRYIPHRNEIAHRINRALFEIVRSTLRAKVLPTCFSGNVLVTATYILNRVTSRSLPKDSISHKLWQGSKPDLKNLHGSGCKCWYTLQSNKPQKLNDRTTSAVFFGIPHSVQGISFSISLFKKLLSVEVYTSMKMVNYPLLEICQSLL